MSDVFQLLVQASPLFLLNERSVGSEGSDLTLSWRPVQGATSAVVESAGVTLGPLPYHDPGVAVPVTLQPSSHHVDLTFEAPFRAIRSITLTGLRGQGLDSDLRGHGDLAGLQSEGDLVPRRLAIAVDLGQGLGMIQYAIPGIGGRGAIPPLMLGASWSNGVLKLPDVPAKKLRLTLQRGPFPEEFQAQEISLDAASARAAPEPLDMEIADTQGTIWAAAGRLAESQRVDLRAALERGLSADPASGRASVTVSAAAAGRVMMSALVAEGYLLRQMEEPLEVTLQGDARDLPLADLDSRGPMQALADVTLRHDGLRLHPLSDPLPPLAGGLGGRIVSGEPVTQVLPPEALRGEELARVGLVGFAKQARLSLRVLEAEGKHRGRLLGEAFGEAEAAVTPGASRPGVTWIALTKPLTVDRPIMLEVSASAPFLWVEEAAPLLRFAVSTEPGGTLVIAGRSLAMTGARTDYPKESLPVGAFAGGPVGLSSEQFCRAIVKNLSLRYAP